jgi:NADPH:quinone reductase-like Zn-dependent oxidoreductase
MDTSLIEERKIQLVKPALLRSLPARNDLVAAVGEIFALVRQGGFATQALTVYRLADAVSAHDDLESQKTTGSIVLRP